MRTLFTIAMISCLAMTAYGQSEADFVRILLPITVRDSPGANGAIWNTDLRISIEPAAGDKLVLPLLGLSACDPPCPEPLLVPADDRTFSIDFFRTHHGETSGSFMYLDPTIRSKIHLSLVVGDATRKTTATELPVVDADDFVANRIVLMAVPITSFGRTTLRVYGYDPGLVGTVGIRAFTEDGNNTKLLDTAAVLSVVQQEYLTPSGTLRLRPPVAELDLTSLVTADETVRVEIAPITPALRVWAFAAVADYATNSISTRTPR